AACVAAARPASFVAPARTQWCARRTDHRRAEALVREGTARAGRARPLMRTNAPWSHGENAALRASRYGFVQLSLPDPGGSSPNFEILNPTAWLITRPFAATPGHG